MCSVSLFTLERWYGINSEIPSMTHWHPVITLICCCRARSSACICTWLDIFFRYARHSAFSTIAVDRAIAHLLMQFSSRRVLLSHSRSLIFSSSLLRHLAEYNFKLESHYTVNTWTDFWEGSGSIDSLLSFSESSARHLFCPTSSTTSSNIS